MIQTNVFQVGSKCSIFVLLCFFSFLELAANQTSTAKDRKSISVTIYNGGVGLVREIREVNLSAGRSSLLFEDVSGSLFPETVQVRSADPSESFRIFEQNFEYDLISNQRLMEKYVGQEVIVYRLNEKTGEETPVRAKLIAYNDGPVYQIGKEISLGLPGRVVVPSLPYNLYSRPTLIWNLFSKEAGTKKMNVSYQTAGMNWSCDYNLVLNDKEDKASIQSWVTLNNSSGVQFENASLQLVAGKVQLITGNNIPVQPLSSYSAKRDSFAEATAPEFAQENLSEFYLYTLDEPTNIGSQQTKQIQLFSIDSTKVEKRFIIENLPMYADNQRTFHNARVRYDILNTKKFGLGRPLPAGTFRMFKADSQNRQQLLGEDRIDHTPDNEWIRVSTGSAFDIVANGKQTSYEVFKISNGYKASYEVEIRNRKKEDVTVRLYANTYGDWKITDSSHSFEKESQQKVYFDVKVGAGKIQKVKYTVENRY